MMTGKRTLPTLQELLAVEDSPEVLNFRFHADGILMWPALRSHLAHRAFMHAYQLDDPFAYAPVWRWNTVLPYAWNTLAHNPLLISDPKDGVVIFSSGITNVNRGGQYFNRLHDHFASASDGKAVMIEDSIRGAYLRPRSFPTVRYHDLIHMLGRLGAMVSAPDKDDTITIHAFIDWLRKHYPYPFPTEVWGEATDILTAKGRRLRFLRFLYRRVFRRLRPKVVIVEDGSYGGRAHIFKWAKESGAATAECQHGMISRAHPAFNYGKIASTKEYQPYLPDHVLTYGTYWNRRVNIPTNLVPVGNPTLTEHLREVSVEKRRSEQTLLIISTGINPVALGAVARDLAASDIGRHFPVVLRPHPSEKPLVDARYGHLRPFGVSIDLTGDLYESILRARAVVGEVSTVLFEARYFGKPVFMLDHPYSTLHIDDGFFPVFADANELITLIEQTPQPTILDAGLFNPSWKTAYRSWLATIN